MQAPGGAGQQSRRGVGRDGFAFVPQNDAVPGRKHRQGCRTGEATFQSNWASIASLTALFDAPNLRGHCSRFQETPNSDST